MTNKTCPFCGAEPDGEIEAYRRWKCGTWWDNNYKTRGDRCYENEIAALKAEITGACPKKREGVMKCIVCNVNEAEVPDRERMGRPIKRVCKQCHSDRLKGDLLHILKVEAEKKERRV